MKVRADLHIHSCLSPCGDLSMAPRDIARTARERELDIVALTDHNSALNCPAFRSACSEFGLYPLFGMEVTTAEELHCLALFGRPEEALRFGDFIAKHYVGPGNIPEKFGDQVYLDEEENILGEVEVNLTQGACDLGLSELGREIHNYGGLFIPAHIDRPSFSVASQLGFLPPDDYDALEVTQPQGLLDTGDFPRTAGSDAHYPEDIGKRCTELDVTELSFHAIGKALKKGKPLFSRKK
ncbi:MAG: PHP domain-containing protein [Spirochaetales bacterium]|nr:PHP domain-containing protein [Spirochaetales bacterium]